MSARPAPREIAVPDGWRLVPVEPTETMLAAVNAQWPMGTGSDTARYRAMVLAAPPAPTDQPAAEPNSDAPEAWRKAKAERDAGWPEFDEPGEVTEPPVGSQDGLGNVGG